MKPSPLLIAALVTAVVVTIMATDLSKNANARQFFSNLASQSTTAHAQ